MTQLRELRCVACNANSPHVTEQEVEEMYPQVSDWNITQEDGIRKLQRLYRFQNFKQALTFSYTVGEMAEEEGHHPRIVTEWGRVMITWWTHKIRDLHRNDFIMAAKTDQLYPAFSMSSEPKSPA